MERDGSEAAWAAALWLQHDAAPEDPRSTLEGGFLLASMLERTTDFGRNWLLRIKATDPELARVRSRLREANQKLVALEPVIGARFEARHGRPVDLRDNDPGKMMWLLYPSYSAILRACVELVVDPGTSEQDRARALRAGLTIASRFDRWWSDASREDTGIVVRELGAAARAATLDDEHRNMLVEFEARAARRAASASPRARAPR